jgi:hypothetical protein
MGVAEGIRNSLKTKRKEIQALISFLNSQKKEDKK